MKIPAIPNLPKKTWALIVAILLVLAAIPGLGLVRFTTTHPLFCLSCHQNQEPTQLWLPSRIHPASVSCTDCHSSPGELIPRKFSASDELMNQNCLRCHPAILERRADEPAECADRVYIPQASRRQENPVHRLPPQHRTRPARPPDQPAHDGDVLPLPPGPSADPGVR